MKYLNFIVIAYILAIISIPIANFFSLDIQILTRFPLFNIKYFDLALFVLLIVTFTSNFSSFKYNKNKTSEVLNFLIVIFCLFQLVNFFRTLGFIEINAQVSFLGSYLALFIVFYINKFMNKEQLKLFLKNKYILLILISFFWQSATLYLYFSGKASIQQDTMGQRVHIDAINQKDVIGTANLLVFTLLLALFRKEIFGFKKIVNLFLTFFIIVTIISSSLSFHRGLLFSIVICVLMYIVYNLRQKRIKIISLSIGLIIPFFIFVIFSETFQKSGINPITNIVNTAEYASDTENSNWEKGRGFVRILAVKIWQKNFWFGIGMDSFNKYIGTYKASTPHNLIITSLVYNGLIGTILFIGIYLIFYIKTFSLLKLLINNKITEEDKMISIILVITAFLWLVPALTQEIQTERYSSSIQYIFFGAIIKINDYYKRQLNGK